MERAVDLCRSKRPIVQPNPGFIAQLLKFERRGGTWTAAGGLQYTREAGAEEAERRPSEERDEAGAREPAVPATT